ncbi:hypothetical protein U8607_10770 [Methylobacterium durans]|uniref:DUF6894 family protein n=1 Tax=Methylobacterium durans TaxID=2202825 RepID=UPI002AFE3037|nr:hypothetical protein [Methylobacterium durans]MEA1832564.1 hypothetical protein [Methylobacterium durans]
MRYYIDIEDRQRYSLDCDGIDLPDHQAAEAEAIAAMLAVCRDAFLGRMQDEVTASVRDEGGGMLFRVKLTLNKESVG